MFILSFVYSIWYYSLWVYGREWIHRAALSLAHRPISSSDFPCMKEGIERGVDLSGESNGGSGTTAAGMQPDQTAEVHDLSRLGR